MLVGKNLKQIQNTYPIIAGNVSFYNESKNGFIPPSPIVSCLGKINDVNDFIGMDFSLIWV
ncbi:MAG: hypothetical protein Ct9H90mP20_7610 [Candidatus Neomarinimicrobiota bacterium]|nr:MAG: hypothetical protein Ct9H90mP20_7610 [Candidatus Neomarinimicrobiota bacterium]